MSLLGCNPQLRFLFIDRNEFYQLFSRIVTTLNSLPMPLQDGKLGWASSPTENIKFFEIVSANNHWVGELTISIFGQNPVEAWTKMEEILQKFYPAGLSWITSREPNKCKASVKPEEPNRKLPPGWQVLSSNSPQEKNPQPTTQEEPPEIIA